MIAADRPPLPPLARGDRLIMRSGTMGRRAGTTAQHEVRVVTVGRKYVHVVAAEHFDDYDPAVDRWLSRKFLLADQREGEPGGRVGYPASVATPEQHEYDRLHGDAREYLIVQGVSLRPGSRWCGHEVALAALMREHEPPEVDR